MSSSLVEAPIRPSEREATYQDVLDAPPSMVAQLIHGKLYTMPRPAPPHVHAQFLLANEIHSHFWFGGGSVGGWRIYNEPEVHFGKDVLVPDIAGWRYERMTALPKTAYFPISPDWVCEVLSESTKRFDLGEKRDIYAEHGVGYLWLVDPIVRQLDAFSLRNAEWELIDTLVGDTDACLPPFEEVTFNLGPIWDEISP